jgi:two-component sensor histidine kinase
VGRSSIEAWGRTLELYPSESDLRLMELRHRLANSFQLVSSLVSIRLRRVSDPEARRQLAWVLDVVTALSLLQRRLAENQQSAFSSYLGEVTSFWQRMSEHVQLTVEAESIEVKPDAATSLALIVHELMTNAVEHAFPDGMAGSVHISLRRAADEGWAELTVTDNGKGLPVGGSRRGSLGMELVERLSRQLGGEFGIAGACGTTARVRFPIS